jgi:hypothetical protein
MKQIRSIYDLPYFASRAEAQDALRHLAGPERPVVMPDHRQVRELTETLRLLARDDLLTERRLLITLRCLQDAGQDVFCGWPDAAGEICGGVMTRDSDAVGSYYQCRLHDGHRSRG